MDSQSQSLPILTTQGIMGAGKHRDGPQRCQPREVGGHPKDEERVQRQRVHCAPWGLKWPIHTNHFFGSTHTHGVHSESTYTPDTSRPAMARMNARDAGADKANLRHARVRRRRGRKRGRNPAKVTPVEVVHAAGHGCIELPKSSQGRRWRTAAAQPTHSKHPRDGDAHSEATQPESRHRDVKGAAIPGLKLK